MRVHTRLALSLIAPPVAALVVLGWSASRPVSAQEDWAITIFNATYDIQADSTILVVEDISVDFGDLEKHGIFREIPVEYAYDSEYNRLTEITAVAVDDGVDPVEFLLEGGRPNLLIRIGDPDVEVSGRQRYVVRYTLSGAMNPFDDHDELYWNITGNEWEVTIEQAQATVILAQPGIDSTTCFEGLADSMDLCTIQQEGDGTRAVFSTREPQPPGSGLTIGVSMPKGVVQVPELVLVPTSGPPDTTPDFDDFVDDTTDFLGLGPLPLAAAVAVLVAGLGALTRVWWVAGRDRWFGNMFYATDNPREEVKPSFSHETIVVEYTPPETESGRRMRPAEIGLLIDERADTLDVSATIVDLAVRKYLKITEVESGGVLGLFKQKDYELEELKSADAELLAYEKRLLESLFDGRTVVKMSDLRNKFHDDLSKVKEDLYEESVKRQKFFPHNPDTVRTIAQGSGVVIALAGGGLTYLLGTFAGAGIIGLPVIALGVLVLLLAHLMPRRTAAGRVMYRRCLGFQLFMVTAERERQRLAEEQNIFHEYLPYAIVYGCVDKWAKALEGLGLEGRETYWYSGPHGFVPLAFAASVSDFSSSVSTVMASTPGGSGGSGFGGGGSSGGGGGGGGGGSW